MLSNDGKMHPVTNIAPSSVVIAVRMSPQKETAAPPGLTPRREGSEARLRVSQRMAATPNETTDTPSAAPLATKGERAPSMSESVQLWVFAQPSSSDE